MIIRALTEKILDGVLSKVGNPHFLGKDLREGSLSMKQFTIHSLRSFSIFGTDAIRKASVKADHLLGNRCGLHGRPPLTCNLRQTIIAVILPSIAGAIVGFNNGPF